MPMGIQLLDGNRELICLLSTKEVEEVLVAAEEGHLHSDLGSTDGCYRLKGHYQPLDGGRFWGSSSSMAPWSLLIVPILPRSQVGIDSSMVN